jgi:hypothetical protein
MLPYMLRRRPLFPLLSYFLTLPQGPPHTFTPLTRLNDGKGAEVSLGDGRGRPRFDSLTLSSNQKTVFVLPLLGSFQQVHVYR